MTIGSMLRIPLLAGAVLAVASPALADVKAGVEAWSRGDYARAVSEWKDPAERGDPDAQFNLGQAYKLGRGVQPDLAKAEELFAKAAAHGHLQAADNYGLLLFQRGDHARAMPYIQAAADRGDPRAQYLLGIAHFNGDNVAKDWVRAYALVSLSRQAGLPQAAPALAQMDKYIPLAQRQQSVALASDLAVQAQATRERQLAAVDLGDSVPTPNSAPATVTLSLPPPGTAAAAVAPPPPRSMSRTPAVASAEKAVAAATAAKAAGTDSPRTAGADFARPQTPSAVTLPHQAQAAGPTPAPTATPAPAPAKPVPAPLAPAKPSVAARTVSPHPAPQPAAKAATPAAAAATGPWRVQLGAFGVPGNAEALWNRVKARPELAGHAKLLVPAGKVAKLQAGGFASQSEAQAACSRLSAAGFTCLPVRN